MSQEYQSRKVHLGSDFCPLLHEQERIQILRNEQLISVRLVLNPSLRTKRSQILGNGHNIRSFIISDISDFGCSALRPIVMTRMTHSLLLFIHPLPCCSSLLSAATSAAAGLGSINVRFTE